MAERDTLNGSPRTDTGPVGIIYLVVALAICGVVAIMVANKVEPPTVAAPAQTTTSPG